MLFAILYRPGPRWNHEQSLFDQDGILDHRDFLGSRFEDKTLVLGGPFLDDSGGISIYRHASQEELVSLLDTDPTIASGLQTYAIHPCALPFAPVALE